MPNLKIGLTGEHRRTVTPDIAVDFLGLEGTHGEQKPLQNVKNLTVLAPVQDMKPVWSDSRVVLMPSGYESYGMVAAEACASGIPVIAHPTPGLKECLGPAGIFIDRLDIDSYKQEIVRLFSDPEYYRKRSELSSKRGLELVSQTSKELKEFVSKLRELVFV